MARKILLKEDGLTGTSNTPSGYRYVGYDGTTVSEKAGATVSSIGGGSLGYKIYSALLTQTGTNAPVATVLENTLSGTPVWSRFGTGDYRLTLTSEFTLNKTVILIGNKEFSLSTSLLDPYDVTVGQVSVNELYLDTFTNSGLADGKLGNNTIPCFIEIRVYP